METLLLLLLLVLVLVVVVVLLLLADPTWSEYISRPPSCRFVSLLCDFFSFVYFTINSFVLS